jgi:hypothetical protein
MRNVDIDPPTSGILHYLQQSSMSNVSDNGYQVQASAIDGTDRLLGGSNELSLRVLSPSGEPVQQFSEDMTKLMHLIVVSRDLSSFQHLHPDYKGDGRFEVAADFPAGGEYLLIEEFVPDDKPITVTKQWVRVAGEERAAAALKPSRGTAAMVVDGLSATVSAMPDLDSLKAGQMVMLEYHLVDAQTGEPVKLEPYLGGTLRYSQRAGGSICACACGDRDEQWLERHVPHRVPGCREVSDMGAVSISGGSRRYTVRCRGAALAAALFFFQAILNVIFREGLKRSVRGNI